MSNSIFDALPGHFTQVFGEELEIVYTPIGGTPITLPPLSVIFEQVPEMVVLGAEPQNAVTKSTLHVPAATIASPQEGDTVLIGDLTWTLVEPIQSDGKGMIVCTLERPSNG